jgi:hypothetical protein
MNFNIIPRKARATTPMIKMIIPSSELNCARSEKVASLGNDILIPLF